VGNQQGFKPRATEPLASAAVPGARGNDTKRDAVPVGELPGKQAGGPHIFSCPVLLLPNKAAIFVPIQRFFESL